MNNSVKECQNCGEYFPEELYCNDCECCECCCYCHAAEDEADRQLEQAQIDKGN